MISPRIEKKVCRENLLLKEREIGKELHNNSNNNNNSNSLGEEVNKGREPPRMKLKEKK
jgi:hypothetical protein